MKNDWIEAINAEDDADKLADVLLESSKRKLQLAMDNVEHAGHRELTELMASLIAMLSSASQRKKDVRLKRKVVKRIRALAELLFEDENIRETDPGDMGRAVSAAEAVLFHSGLYTLRGRLQQAKSEKIHAENAEEFEADRVAAEQARAEMAEATPMDGVDQDLAADDG